jgi:hypothetical protein
VNKPKRKKHTRRFLKRPHKPTSNTRRYRQIDRHKQDTHRQQQHTDETRQTKNKSPLRKRDLHTQRNIHRIQLFSNRFFHCVCTRVCGWMWVGVGKIKSSSTDSKTLISHLFRSIDQERHSKTKGQTKPTHTANAHTNTLTNTHHPVRVSSSHNDIGAEEKCSAERKEEEFGPLECGQACACTTKWR